MQLSSNTFLKVPLSSIIKIAGDSRVVNRSFEISTERSPAERGRLNENNWRKDS